MERHAVADSAHPFVLDLRAAAGARRAAAAALTALPPADALADADGAARPPHVTVVGGGAAGCALAGRLVGAGSRVALVCAAPRCAPHTTTSLNMIR